MKTLTIEHDEGRLTYFTVEEMKNHLMIYTDDLQNFSIPVPKEFVDNEPTETLEITENGIYDVKDYAKVDVNINKIKEFIERSIKEVDIPEDTANIGNFAFASCTELDNVVIPDTISEIGQGAFMNCINLQNIKLPENLLVIASFTFQNCWKLNNIELPNITRIGTYAFQHCNGLTSITLPSTITEIASNAFQNCDNLETIYCNFEEGAVEGAPWGATNATIVYSN